VSPTTSIDCAIPIKVRRPGPGVIAPRSGLADTASERCRLRVSPSRGTLDWALRREAGGPVSGDNCSR
jgi:hypothetical protein